MNEKKSSERPSHLVIVGGGSAAFSAALTAEGLGLEVTLINEGLPIGGTCVNVGCVPSKALLRAAESLHRAQHTPFDGIGASGEVTDFAAVMAQKQSLVEGLRQVKYLDVISGKNKIRRVEGRGRFVAKDRVSVETQEGTREIQGDLFLIATGTRPASPAIPGLDEVPCLDNESAFELCELPESMIVLGGRYIALEMAQMFARFGTKITVLQRSASILPTESEALTSALAGYLTQEGLDIQTSVRIEQIEEEGGQILIRATQNGEPREYRAARLLSALGRAPNTEGLGLEEIGVALTDRDFVAIDETLQTSQPGIFAAGDVIDDPSFVYTAAFEGALAVRNGVDGALEKRDYTALPWVVFTDPQVAGVGLDEKQAADLGLVVDSRTLPLDQVPRSLAARDTRGFVQLIRDPERDVLVGGRVLAAEGSELLMEIAMAIRYQIPVRELARSFHAYLTLSEAVKLAAITFEKDIKELSCCAS